MISVIIPSFNRSQLVNDLIENLQGQTLDSDEYEILIIDDGSTSKHIEGIKESACKYSNIKFIEQAHKGPGIARNRGLKEAMGDIICFIDDDCIPNQDWLEIIKGQLYQARDAAGLEGLTYTSGDKIGPLTHSINNTKGSLFYPTCNIAYRASVLKRVGGFDTNFPYAHNEDVDLAWRVMEFGKIEYCKNMIVRHRADTESIGKKIRRLRYLESEFYLYHKHPQKYREVRAANAWINIYWRIHFKNAIMNVLHWVRYWKRPLLFIQSITLFIIKIICLLYLVPYFYKANKSFKRMDFKGNDAIH